MRNHVLLRLLLAPALVILLGAPAFAQTPHPLQAAPASADSFTTSSALKGISFVSESPAALGAAALVQAGSPHGRRHQLGLGGRVGGFNFGVGGSVRYWGSDKWGAQVDISHYSIGCGNAFCGNFSILQLAPAALIMLGQPDLSKDTQVRPYVGVGLNIFHASASAAFLGSASGTSTGIEAFVGAEMVFRAMPNFGVSGDIGFYQTGTFGGVDVGGLAIALSGHYYIK